MDFNQIDELKKFGFTGFRTIDSLWEDHSIIPKERGVYLVLNMNYELPVKYLAKGVGGFFKGKNPNASLSELNGNYINDSLVVYIGKAGSLKGNATLNSRLRQYLRFGLGKNVGHWGGRLIWQLANHQDLVFCWKLIAKEDPRLIEKELISLYRAQFGKMPFANLTG